MVPGIGAVRLRGVGRHLVGRDVDSLDARALPSDRRVPRGRVSTSSVSPEHGRMGLLPRWSTAIQLRTIP